MISIQPVGVFPDTGVFIRFADITIVIGDKARSTWQILDASENVIVGGAVEMIHEQYLNWGTDDSYAEDCFMENLGLTRA